ncbi:sensor histidine kinase [Micromonospora sp. CA-240977]|uniref:sensor histidine kinase n=1 Tax=Micromonospora sp. CA-240977 TaxID=3239957 RepID=UPI003D92B09E
MVGTPRGLRDTAFGLLLAAGFALEVTVVLSHRPGWPVGVALVAITAAVCAAALLRRRFPGSSAATAIVLCGAAELIDWQTGRHGQPAPIAFLALLAVVASAVRSLPGAVGAVAVAAGAGLVAVGTVERYATYLEQGIPNARTATLIAVTGWASAVMVGVWLRVADARGRATIDRVRRAERLALARDLHDVAAHHLTGLIIQTQVAKLDAEAAPPRIRDSLVDIETAGAQALDSLRQVVRLLRDDEPMTLSLADLVDRFRATGIRARLDLPDGPIPPGWPPETTIGVYRIVQEALTNVAQHARGARTAVVTLAHDQRTVRLSVADDGRRRSAAGRDGHGLVGMRERASALGGRLSAGPSASKGWTVEATLPTPGST